MGGRGSASGISKNHYGSQYRTLHEYENIKFVTNVSKNYEPLMESKTAGRVYVQIGGNDIVRIVFIGAETKETKLLSRIKNRKNGTFTTDISTRNILKMIMSHYRVTTSKILKM